MQHDSPSIKLKNVETREMSIHNIVFYSCENVENKIQLSMSADSQT